MALGDRGGALEDSVSDDDESGGYSGSGAQRQQESSDTDTSPDRDDDNNDSRSRSRRRTKDRQAERSAPSSGSDDDESDPSDSAGDNDGQSRRRMKDRQAEESPPSDSEDDSGGYSGSGAERQKRETPTEKTSNRGDKTPQTGPTGPTQDQGKEKSGKKKPEPEGKPANLGDTVSKSDIRQAVEEGRTITNIQDKPAVASQIARMGGSDIRRYDIGDETSVDLGPDGFNIRTSERGMARRAERQVTEQTDLTAEEVAITGSLKEGFEPVLTKEAQKEQRAKAAEIRAEALEGPPDELARGFQSEEELLGQIGPDDTQNGQRLDTQSAKRQIESDIEEQANVDLQQQDIDFEKDIRDGEMVITGELTRSGKKKIAQQTAFDGMFEGTPAQGAARGLATAKFEYDMFRKGKRDEFYSGNFDELTPNIKPGDFIPVGDAGTDAEFTGGVPGTVAAERLSQYDIGKAIEQPIETGKQVVTTTPSDIFGETEASQQLEGEFTGGVPGEFAYGKLSQRQTRQKLSAGAMDIATDPAFQSGIETATDAATAVPNFGPDDIIGENEASRQLEGELTGGTLPFYSAAGGGGLANAPRAAAKGATVGSAAIGTAAALATVDDESPQIQTGEITVPDSGEYFPQDEAGLPSRPGFFEGEVPVPNPQEQSTGPTGIPEEGINVPVNENVDVVQSTEVNPGPPVAGTNLQLPDAETTGGQTGIGPASAAQLVGMQEERQVVREEEEDEEVTIITEEDIADEPITSDPTKDFISREGPPGGESSAGTSFGYGNVPASDLVSIPIDAPETVATGRQPINRIGRQFDESKVMQSPEEQFLSFQDAEPTLGAEQQQQARLYEYEQVGPNTGLSAEESAVGVDQSQRGRIDIGTDQQPAVGQRTDQFQRSDTRVGAIPASLERARATPFQQERAFVDSQAPEFEQPEATVPGFDYGFEFEYPEPTTNVPSYSPPGPPTTRRRPRLFDPDANQMEQFGSQDQYGIEYENPIATSAEVLGVGGGFEPADDEEFDFGGGGIDPDKLPGGGA